jgi:TolB protein
MKIKPLTFLLAASLITMHALPAIGRSVLRVSIAKGFRKRVVIAFPGVYPGSLKDPALSAELDSLLRHDLKLSGRVALVPDQKRVDRLGAAESFSKTDFDAWNELGVEFLLKVELAEELGVPRIRFRIFDCGIKKEFKNGEGKGSRKQFRDLGHRVGEDILAALTGHKGIGTSRIAFVSDRRGTKTIYDCDVQGKDVRQLVFDEAMVISPDWGPNRESLVYTSYRNINPGVFIKYFPSNRFESVSLFPGLNANPRINSQSEVLFTASRDGNPEIYRKNILTGKTRRLTRRTGVDANACWSPDNRTIAFVSSASGSPQIYLMSRDGRDIRRLTRGSRYNTAPAFSPDGRYLAFSSQIRRNLNLLLYDFETDTTEVLVSHMKNTEAPCFAPDSMHIAFHSDRGGETNLFAVDIHTREIFPITKNLGNCTNPSWE